MVVHHTQHTHIYTHPALPLAAENVAGNKTVIMYILSQLRIGMDLSRVTLPAFILERRSTLELYADFLSHTDLFVK